MKQTFKQALAEQEVIALLEGVGVENIEWSEGKTADELLKELNLDSDI